MTSSAKQRIKGGEAIQCQKQKSPSDATNIGRGRNPNHYEKVL